MLLLFRRVTNATDILLTGFINLFLFGLLAAIRHQFHKEGLHSFLWSNDRYVWRRLFEGIVVGIFANAAYTVLVLVAGQGMDFFTGSNKLDILLLLGASVFGYFAVALFEEALFRSYLLKKLLERFPLWIAIRLPSVLFGGLHFMSELEGPSQWLNLMNCALFGVILSLGTIKSRSLWWAVGFHWSYNVTQTCLLARQTLQHADLLYLATYDVFWVNPSIPEAGLAIILVIFLLWIYVTIRFRLPAKPSTSPTYQVWPAR